MGNRPIAVQKRKLAPRALSVSANRRKSHVVAVPAPQAAQKPASRPRGRAPVLWATRAFKAPLSHLHDAMRRAVVAWALLAAAVGVRLRRTGDDALLDAGDVAQPSPPPSVASNLARQAGTLAGQAVGAAVVAGVREVGAAAGAVAADAAKAVAGQAGAAAKQAVAVVGQAGRAVGQAGAAVAGQVGAAAQQAGAALAAGAGQAAAVAGKAGAAVVAGVGKATAAVGQAGRAVAEGVGQASAGLKEGLESQKAAVTGAHQQAGAKVDAAKAGAAADVKAAWQTAGKPAVDNMKVAVADARDRIGGVASRVGADIAANAAAGAKVAGKAAAEAGKKAGAAVAAGAKHVWDNRQEYAEQAQRAARAAQRAGKEFAAFAKQHRQELDAISGAFKAKMDKAASGGKPVPSMTDEEMCSGCQIVLSTVLEHTDTGSADEEVVFALHSACHDQPAVVYEACAALMRVDAMAASQLIVTRDAPLVCETLALCYRGQSDTGGGGGTGAGGGKKPGAKVPAAAAAAATSGKGKGL
jgi:hypothetical protein